MDAIVAVRHYVEKIINDPQLEGMKALLLDPETTSIVSMVLSQSQILQRESSSWSRSTPRTSPCCTSSRGVSAPTAANIELLKKELKNPKFGQYHIFFSNILPVELLERLAEADEKESCTRSRSTTPTFSRSTTRCSTSTCAGASP
ncbi:hypothetical protein PINS_up021587 [Pythium insidiosum]|nr:hypothetical protein PINS_up021587 [Pythium insidiosum]